MGKGKHIACIRREKTDCRACYGFCALFIVSRADIALIVSVPSILGSACVLKYVKLMEKRKLLAYVSLKAEVFSFQILCDSID